MKPYLFLVVLAVFLLIYSAANYYIYIRGIQAFSVQQPLKRWVTIAFIIISYSFFVGIILERVASSALSEWIFRIGSFWLPVMLYLIMVLVLIDLVRLFDHFFHFLPDVTESIKFSAGLIVVSLVTLVVFAGHINALSVNVKHIPLTINKKVEGKGDVRILMASFNR